MSAHSRREFLHRTGLVVGAAALGACGPRPAALARSPDGALGFETAIELAARLRRREMSSVELTEYFIGRIERHDEKLNAVVVRDFDRALAAATAADAAMARGEVRGPLHGLPMTIKEAYDFAGLATAWGVPAAAKSAAAEDAVVVSRLRRAGVHFLGKTNVPLMLGDFQTYNEIHGTTNNPWDVTRTPGGSSGGSAAALAAGMAGLESGSDIGGSIRNPSHYCGVYGHKPTLGVIPMRGHAPPGVPPTPQDPDLAVVGPLARSAEDLALALDILAGPDVLQAPGWRLELPPPRRSELRGLRVALWPDDPVAPVAREMSERVIGIGDRLTRLGAKVSDKARPAFPAAASHRVYRTLLSAMTGPPVGGEQLSYRTWMELNAQRGAFRVQWQEFFRDWDVLVCPISATTAFAHDHRHMAERTLLVDGRARPYMEQIFWAGLATLCYLPSTVFPTGLSSDGLPIGLQAIGAEFDDRTTIEFARLMAGEIGGFVPPPGYGD